MATDQGFVDFVVDQLEGAGIITWRKMFGEYALYCDGKVVALLCDNQLFIKQTVPGRAFIGDVVEAPAYPGGSVSFLIGERIDDRSWLTSLIRITADALPEPKAKAQKRLRKKR